MAKHEVAVTGTKPPMAVIAPDWMKDQIGLGTENLSASDGEIPRLKLMQKLSPELEEHNSLKAGDFWHAIAEANMGPSVRVTPIFIDIRYVLWRPRNSGGGILARADDGVHWSPPNVEFTVKLKSGRDVTWRTADTVERSGLDRWGSEDPSDPNSPPAATKMYSVVVSFADDPSMPPAVVTLQRASIKVAHRFIGKLKITRAPSFGLVFNMQSVKDTSPSGEFYNFAFKADGMVEDKKVYDQNYAMYQFFKKQGLQVKDLESAQEDEVPVEQAPAGAPKI